MKMSPRIQHHDILNRGTMSHSAKNLPSYPSLAVAGIASRIIRGHIIQEPDQKDLLEFALILPLGNRLDNMGFEQNLLYQCK